MNLCLLRSKLQMKSMKRIACLFLILLILVLSACNSENNIIIDLHDYLGRDIGSILEVVDDLSNEDNDQSDCFTNDQIEVVLDSDQGSIVEIAVFDKCNYSIFGITYGMNADAARRMIPSWFSVTSNDNDEFISANSQDGSALSIYLDGDTVDTIYLMNYELAPYDEEDDEYEESFDPDEFNYVYDYSNYGFYDADYGATWLRVKEYSFSDSDNSYVIAFHEQPTLTFNAGTLKEERWNKSDNEYKLFDMNNGARGGQLWFTATYQIVDNNTLTFTSGIKGCNSVYISDLELRAKVPFISCKFDGHTGIPSSGVFIPTDVIDWTRSPEEMNTYYIKREYVE